MNRVRYGRPETMRVPWMAFRFLLCLVLFATAAPAATAHARDAEQRPHRGILFQAYPAAPSQRLDADPVVPAKALQRMMDAHDLLFVKSKRAAEAVDRLKRAGRVAIVYDPHFPERSLRSATIAAFLPDHFDTAAARGTFVVIVGRYGIEWPTSELAVVLAHELLGHGIQHLEGRLLRMRNLDLECEAFLWTEQAMQDLGLDKDARSAISLRREIERHWCADYIAWSAANRPALAGLWEARNPDIPALAEGFRAYAAHLEKSGQAERATAADTIRRGRLDETARAAAAASGDPDREYNAALAYKSDRTAPENFETALKLLRKAAEDGHREAQFTLGFALLRELPDGQDTEGARRWLRAAAAQGHERAQSVLRLIPGG